MNSPHYYSRSRKYFLHFGSLFPFLLNRLATFFSRLNLYRFLTLQVHLEMYSAHEAYLVTSLLWGSNTYSTSSAMFVTGIIGLFRSNCPRGVQKRISLEAAILCSKSEARFSDTAQERWFKTSFILGSLSSLLSPELTFVFFMFTLVLFFNQIFLSLHFDQYRWET